jgi:hypothetical protein
MTVLEYSVLTSPGFVVEFSTWLRMAKHSRGERIIDRASDTARERCFSTRIVPH